MREQPWSTTLRRTLVDGDQALRRAGPGALPADANLDEIAAAAASGEVEAVGHLYDALLEPIYRYVAVRVGRREDAEDLTQLVFERIVAALPGYRDRGLPFAAWAFRIARNAVIDHHRRARATERLGTIAEPIDGLELEALSLRTEEVRELREAMARLTADQREALLLRYVAGLSAEEAAAVMGRQAGTIRGLTFRAIGALRRHLAREGER